MFAESGVDLIVVEITENVHNGNRSAARIICARIAATINYSSCIWWRAMHLAPCVPALRFVRRLYSRPFASTIIISSNRGRKWTTPPQTFREIHRWKTPSILRVYNFRITYFPLDEDTFNSVQGSVFASPRFHRDLGAARKMAELGTRCTIDRFRAGACEHSSGDICI